MKLRYPPESLPKIKSLSLSLMPESNNRKFSPEDFWENFSGISKPYLELGFGGAIEWD